MDLKKQKYRTKSLITVNDSVKKQFGLQHFISIRNSDPISQKKWEMLLNFLIDAEKTCPASAEYLFSLIAERRKENCIPVDKESLHQLFEELDIEKDNIELLKVISEITKCESHLTIHESANEKTYIEFVNGHRFELKRLLPIREKGSNVKVICIDGYIENVSELHMLFTQLCETKTDCLMVCRGMSNDVLHTIKVNVDRGTLHIRPYVAPFDIDNVNTIVDIAIVSGTDVVSSTKGDLISTVDLSKAGTVLDVSEYGNSVNIRSNVSITSHVNRLRQQREERPDIQEILDKRLRSLTSSCVRVFIPNNLSFFDNKRQLDLGIRILSMLMRGIYEPSAVAEKYYKMYSSNVNSLFTLDESSNIIMEENANE